MAMDNKRKKEVAEKVKQSMEDERIEKILAKVRKVFPSADSVNSFRPDGFTIEVRYHDTTFAELAAISEAFGTKNINLAPRLVRGDTATPALTHMS